VWEISNITCGTGAWFAGKKRTKKNPQKAAGQVGRQHPERGKVSHRTEKKGGLVDSEKN